MTTDSPEGRLPAVELATRIADYCETNDLYGSWTKRRAAMEAVRIAVENAAYEAMRTPAIADTIDALRATIEDLTAERDTLGAWLAKERDLKQELVERAAADTPKLQGAHRDGFCRGCAYIHEAMNSQWPSGLAFDASFVTAACDEAHRLALAAAFTEEPEGPQPEPNDA